MIYKVLGKTGLEVSVVGFGASPLGHEFGLIDPDEGKRAVHYAVENGINYFDVAPYYGRTLAETRLGEALVGYRDKVILATKVGRYDIDQFDFSAEGIIKSVEESLVRLKTDYIDVFQVHDIEFGFGDRVRITAQFIDAFTGNHIWADRYDRNVKDIFAVQDEISMKIITELQVKLTEGERARLWSRGTENIESYFKLLKGRQNMALQTPDGDSQA